MTSVHPLPYLHQPRQRKTKTIRLATLATPTPTSRNQIADQVRLPGFGLLSAPLPQSVNCGTQICLI